MSNKSGYKLPNWTSVPNTLINEIPEMGNAELRVTLVVLRNTIGFHRRTFQMSLTEMAGAAGLSRKGVLEGADDAEQRGGIQRVQDGGVTRWAIILYGNYGLPCPLCGQYPTTEVGGQTVEVEFHKHHIFPASRGGDNSERNIIEICVECHQSIHELAEQMEGELERELSESEWRSLLSDVLVDQIIDPHMGVDAVTSGNQLKKERSPGVTRAVKSGNHAGELGLPPSIKEKKETPVKETDKEQQQVVAAAKKQKVTSDRAREIARWALQGVGLGKIKDPVAWATAAAREGYQEPHWFDPKLVDDYEYQRSRYLTEGVNH